MADQLTNEQVKRIEDTLKRIRGGLAKSEADPLREPGHTFDPEAFRDVSN